MAELLQVLDTDDVTLGCEATDMESAIRMVGAQLVERGAVDSEYIDGMLQREQTVSTYLGNGGHCRTGCSTPSPTSDTPRS